MKLRLRHLILIVVFTLVSFTLSSCSKKETQLQATKESLLQELPPGAYGFYYLDTTTTSFREAQKGPWGIKSQKDFLGALQGGEAVDSMKVYINIIEKAKIFNFDASKPAPFKEALGFVVKDSPFPVGAGMYLAAASGVNMEEMLSDIRNVLKEEQIASSDQTFEGGKGFSLTVKKTEAEGGANAPTQEIFMASNKDRLALATSKVLAERALKPATEKGFAALESSERYKQAFGALGSRKAEMAIAYIDIRSLIDAFAAFTPPSPNADQAKNFPLESVAVSVGMTPDLSTSIAIPVAPKTTDQEKWFKVISNSGSRGVMDRMPAKPVLLLSVDGSVIGAIKSAALESAEPEKRAALEPVLKVLDSLKNTTISFSNAAGGASPFPELMIGAEADDAAGVVQTIKDGIASSVKDSGAPVPTEWQSKDIDGHKVAYIMSPLGVGVFMAHSDKSIIVASSETAVQSFLGGAKSNAGSFVSGLEKSAKDLLESKTSPIVFYLGFKQLYELLTSLQGTLAMFTGGKAAMDTSQYESLKEKGDLLVALTYDKSVLKLDLVQGKAAVS